MDRNLWQIGVLGSECLDRRSSRRAWIGDRESVSDGEADPRSSRRAWIGVLLAMLGSETERADRRLWRIGVLGSAIFSPCLDRRQKEWIGILLGAVLPARIGDREWIGWRDRRGNQKYYRPGIEREKETRKFDREREKVRIREVRNNKIMG